MPDTSGLKVLVDQDAYYAAAPVVNKVNIVTSETLETRGVMKLSARLKARANGRTARRRSVTAKASWSGEGIMVMARSGIGVANGPVPRRA